MPRARRLRGILLRLVLNRRLAVSAGALVALPGIVLMSNSYAWETGATDGIALLSVASGAALAWAGFSGRNADWVE